MWTVGRQQEISADAGADDDDDESIVSPLRAGDTINALCKMSRLVCFLSSWRKEGLIFVRQFVGEQTSKIIVYQFCTDNPLVKHTILTIVD